MRPAKPSLENPNNSPLPTNPEIFGGMNQRSSIRIPDLAEGVYAESVKPPVPMEGVCDNCEVIAFRLTDDNSGLEEIRVFSDGGVPLCRIFIDAGTVIHDDCGWTR